LKRAACLQWQLPDIASLPNVRFARQERSFDN
jgi:hypothetical protein